MNLSDYLANAQRAEAFSWFLTSKFGYGSWDAPYWFIGMEEAGGCSCGDVINRISSWRQAEHGLEDLREYCAGIGEDKWFTGNDRQPTWIWLIQLLMAAAPHVGEELEPNNELAFQQQRWGRRNGPTCMVEFSPLPSPKTTVWRYREWCPQGEFASRQALWAAQGRGQQRVERIRMRIANAANAGTLRWIVFYGKGTEFQPHFNSIAGLNLGELPPNRPANNRIRCGMIQAGTRSVPCLFTNHPAAPHGQGWTIDDVNAAAAWLMAHDA